MKGSEEGGGEGVVVVGGGGGGGTAGPPGSLTKSLRGQVSMCTGIVCH